MMSRTATYSYTLFLGSIDTRKSFLCQSATNEFPIQPSSRMQHVTHKNKTASVR